MADDPLFYNVKELIFPDNYRKQIMGFAIGPEPFRGSSLESEESFSLMRERENRHFPRSDYLSRLRDGSLDLGIRREAVDWIFKVHSHYCFGPLSFCLAINYLDRFLSVFEIPGDNTWMVQLLAVACLSIALKIAENTVPLTENIQVCEPKYVFERKLIQKAELVILIKLEWQMQACTPFSFLDYFLRKTNDEIQLSSLGLVSRSIQLILSTAKEIEFLEFRPSVVAAAAAISVSIWATPDKAIACFNDEEKGRVLRCLKLIKDLNLVPDCVTATSSSFPQTPSGVLDAASSSTNTMSTDDSSPAKRRRLDRND